MLRFFGWTLKYLFSHFRKSRFALWPILECLHEKNRNYWNVQQLMRCWCEWVSKQEIISAVYVIMFICYFDQINETFSLRANKNKAEENIWVNNLVGKWLLRLNTLLEIMETFWIWKILIFRLEFNSVIAKYKILQESIEE